MIFIFYSYHKNNLNLSIWDKAPSSDHTLVTDDLKNRKLFALAD